MHPTNQAFTDMAKHAEYLQRELTPHEQAAYLQGHQDGMVYARAALSPPQPVAGWREWCVVEECKDGDWDVVSPCGKFWMNQTGWWAMFESGKKIRSMNGYFTGGEVQARAALAACPTPPPGVQA